MPTTPKKKRTKKNAKAPKGKAGRPPLFVVDPSTMRRIIDLVRAGNFPDVAAQATGVPRSTFYDWMKRGADLRRLVATSGYTPRGYEVDLVSFSDDIERASAESEIRDVVLIGKAAEKDWKAAAHRLERRHRSRWAKDNVEAGRHAFDGGDDDSLDNAVEALASALDAMAARRTR
jgi:hypothetical protein